MNTYDTKMQPRRKGTDIAILVVLVGVGAALRLYNSSESLWLDELHTSWAVVGGAGTLSERALKGNTLPPYCFLVWASNTLFGPTELSTRLPSLVFGIVLIPATYLVVFRLTRVASVALLAAAFVSFDALCISYAATARVYTVLQFATLVHFAAFWQVHRSPTFLRRAAFIGSLLLLFYLQVIAVLLICGEVVYFLHARRLRPTPAYRLKALVLTRFLL
jgi:uncharacterized membrane protein